MPYRKATIEEDGLDELRTSHKPVAVIDESKAEPVGKTRLAINKELKGLMPHDGMVMGVIGQEKEETPDPVEVLSAEDRAAKRELIAFLMKCIEPPQLSQNHPNPVRDKASFVLKLNKQSFGELRRIWGKKILSDDAITEELKAELQRRWETVSP